VGFIDTLLARNPQERDAEPVNMVGFPTGGNSGVLPYAVSTPTAVGLSAVWRCLDVLGSIATLPWSERRGTLDLPLSRLTRQPVSFYTRREWTQLVIRSMALYDVAYLLKLEPYDTEGVPTGLWPVPPQIIMPKNVDMYALTPPVEYTVGRTTISAENLVIIRRAPNPGIPDYLGGLLQQARATFAAAISAENYASRYWQGGGAPTTVLETEANLSDPQATQLGNRWAQRRAQGPDHPAILSNGLKARPWGADPTAQAAVEARRDMVAEVARYVGVPPRFANAPSVDSQTYKNAEEENIDLLHYTLQNYVCAIQDAITDLLPGGRELLIDTTSLTEGTQLARYTAYNFAANAATPWMTTGDIREAEGMPPMEMGMMEDDDSQRPMAPMPSMAPAAGVVAATTGRPSA
jgi:HK97 family phage portal protein